eukprot:CAMPEP_0168728682 /NCGR_PEP_ID=MMETSP0724-20121128/5810_1 /TAXON_ID=265536 /ORGANISM="Amphiprora sp., Strain CCMP467" /LENGTH=232 /DNA_ID=CAMNT_0008775535 /DNA_START=210 /DNA_END=909 /DNA_ORIENTATION=-
MTSQNSNHTKDNPKDTDDALLLSMMKEAFPDASEQNLLRCWTARNWNVAPAKAMNVPSSSLDWRTETIPRLQQERKEETLSTRKFYRLESPDADGRRVLLLSSIPRTGIQCGNGNQGGDLFDGISRASPIAAGGSSNVITAATTATTTATRQPQRQQQQQQQQQFTCLIDVSGIRSPPLSFLTHLNSVMEANDPELLYKTILFPVPGFVQTMIGGMLVPLVDPQMPEASLAT